VLVKKIVTIKHIVVPTETDALLLENNLIKTLQPRYNVLLRDDKSYPWICIKKEPFSRIFATRRMVKDGSEYFGPYTSFKTVNTILELIGVVILLFFIIYLFTYLFGIYYSDIYENIMHIVSPEYIQEQSYFDPNRSQQSLQQKKILKESFTQEELEEIPYNSDEDSIRPIQGRNRNTNVKKKTSLITDGFK